MKRSIAVAAISMALFAVGCATGYQSSDVSLTGGFSETRLTPDSWRVLVEGNGFTTRGEVEKFLLRRGAELTLEQGKRYFVLEGHDAWLRTKRTSRRSVVLMPANQAVVIALDEKERDAFDAVQIIEETNEVAGGKLSTAARKSLETLKAQA